MLLMIARFLGALSSYGKPAKIALAMATGISLALIPGGSLLWLLIFVPMMLIRINQAALIGTMAVTRLFMPLVDPYSERLGFFILNRPFIREPMTEFLNQPGTGWFRLNDSLVFGGMFLGIGGWLLWFAISLVLILLFRKYLAAKLKSVFHKIGRKVPLLGKLGKAVTLARGSGGSV